MYDDKIKAIEQKTNGQLIIKEYPTASAHSNHFRGLIKELAIKMSFKPDIIFIDYLNICASSRFKANGNVNSYMYIKAIAEELRGLAVETNVPIMSATQTTRSGFSNSDVGLEDTSESFGLPATADLMFALISNEELDELNQIAVKQLKNRYNDPTTNKRFVIGIDRAKMKLYDVEDAEQIQKLYNEGYTISAKTAEKYKDELGLNQEERLVGELARLQTIMMIFEDKEEYEKAAMILKKIDKINEKLNEGSGKY